MTLWKRIRPYRTTLALVLVALAAVVLFLLDRSRLTTDEKEARSHNLLPAWRESDIRRIDVRTSDDAMALVRMPPADGGADDSDAWELLRGEGHLDADPQAVSQWLSTLELATYQRAAQGNDDRLGLDPPAISIGIDMGGVTLLLVIGAETETDEGARYAAVALNDDPRKLYVVSKQLYAALSEGIAALPARLLTPYFSLDLEAIALESVAKKWRLVRGGWQGRDAASFAVARGEATIRASRDGVDRLLGALGRLETDHLMFPKEPRNPDARFTIVLSPRDHARPEARMEIGGACPGAKEGVYIVRTGTRLLAGCVPAAVAHELEVAEADLVDRRLVGATPEEIMEFALQDATRKVELARRDEGWHMRTPVDAQLEGEVVDSRIDALVAAEGEVVDPPADLAAAGLEPPMTTARFTSHGRSGGPERVEAIALGSPQDGKLIVRRAEDGAYLRIEAATARPFMPSAETLRSLEVLSVELRWFRGLRVESTAVRQALTRDANGTWTLSSPKIAGLRADPGLASELAERLGRLQAVSWVADRADPSMGLEQPWCRIEADVAEEEKPDGPFTKIAIALGAATEGGYFARKDGDPAVFVAPKGLGEMAQRWLVDRTALLVDMDRIERVTLRRGEGKLVVERQAGKLHVTSGPNKTDAAALAVEDALRSLMAEGVVHLGGADAAEGFATPALTLEIELANAGEAPTQVRLDVGRGEAWHDNSVFWVRRAGLDATFAVAQSRLRPLLELL